MYESQRSVDNIATPHRHDRRHDKMRYRRHRRTCVALVYNAHAEFLTHGTWMPLARNAFYRRKENLFSGRTKPKRSKGSAHQGGSPLNNLIYNVFWPKNLVLS